MQIREQDKELFKVLRDINNADVEETVKVERQVMRGLDGGCQLPLGVFCERNDESWVVHASYASDKNQPSKITRYK